jgi:DNA sulfur modification protein DndD
MNGAGKTTLLQSIRLALYGRTSVGERIGEKAYRHHLRSLIHRSPSALIQLDFASVGVEFAYVSRGHQDVYFVRRSWTARGEDEATETLQVFRRPDGANASDPTTWPTLEDLEPEHWQAFIDGIVPERLSQLFFFDGERIKRIADDVTGDAAIAEAIRVLLGLDTVARLRADLGIIAAREAKKGLSEDDAAALEQAEHDRDDTAQTFRRLEEERAALETRHAGIEGELRRIEIQLEEQGGGLAADRPTKQIRLAAIEVEIEAIHKVLRTHCEGLLPLAACPTIAGRLQHQLKLTLERSHNQITRGAFLPLQKRFAKVLERSQILNSRAARGEAERALREAIADYAASSGDRDPTSSDLSATDRARILSWLEEARDKAAVDVRRQCNLLERRERELQEVRRQLDLAPDEAPLLPLFEQLQALSVRKGETLAELRGLDEQIAQARSDLAVKERLSAKLLEGAQARAADRQRLALIWRAHSALAKYLDRLTAMKVEALSRAVATCFVRLSRKGDLLHAVSIDARTFEVTLRDKEDRVIPRDELSAGEKQILAVSILWGLARTSGRPLPVIVDTPLGRLDSAHRLNLIRNYFPHAGHQVILLSTDTEVDRELLGELQQHVSHCYHLGYDMLERRTKLTQGYFWREPAHA